MGAYYNRHIDVSSGQLLVKSCCTELIERFRHGDLNNIETLHPSYTNSFCSRNDIEHLLDKQMLRDDVMDLFISVYKEKILHKVPLPPSPCYFVNVHAQKFTERIKKDTSYMNKYIDMTSKDLANGNALLFVVIYSPNHWSLLVLNFGTRRFLSYDSMNTEAVFETYLWVDLLKRYFVEQHQLQGLRDWPHIHCESPKQTASLDCGLFVLKYIDYLAYDQPLKFSQDDMDHLREVYAATLIAESAGEGENHLCYYQCSVKKLLGEAAVTAGREGGQGSRTNVLTAVAGAAGILQNHHALVEKLKHANNMKFGGKNGAMVFRICKG